MAVPMSGNILSATKELNKRRYERYASGSYNDKGSKKIQLTYLWPIHSDSGVTKFIRPDKLSSEKTMEYALQSAFLFSLELFVPDPNCEHSNV